MWMEENLGKRVNVERTEEAISTDADTMGVACPFCLIMLDDAAKAKGGDLKVVDVAQVVAQATGVGGSSRPAPPVERASTKPGAVRAPDLSGSGGS